MDIVRDESVKRKKRRNRIIIGVLGVLLLMAVFLGVSLMPQAAPGVDYGTIWPDTVKRGSMLRQVRGIGTLVPIPEDVRQISAETDVRVERILVLPGTPVKPDTVIMELSNPQVEADQVGADLDLKSAEAQSHNKKAEVDTSLLALKAEAATVEDDYENAKRDADEKREEAKIGVVSASALAIAEAKEKELATRLRIEQDRIAENTKAIDTQMDVEKATIDQKRAMAALRHKQYADLKVRAGITGVLQELGTDASRIQVGQRYPQGAILAKVVQPDHLKAELKIPETQAKDIMDHQFAEIDTHNGVVNGHVSRIDPAVLNGTVTVDVTLDAPPPKGSRPDLSVDGTITLEKLDNILYVGRPALGQEKSKVGMFKITPDGKYANRVNVDLGRASVNTIEIVGGLREGDQVILSDMSRWDKVDRIKLEK